MDKLVGEYLRDITSLTATQIVDALRNQLILKDEGNHRLLGELLVDAGHVTKEQVDEALKRQSSARGSRIEPPFVGPFHGTSTVTPPRANM